MTLEAETVSTEVSNRMSIHRARERLHELLEGFDWYLGCDCDVVPGLSLSAGLIVRVTRSVERSETSPSAQVPRVWKSYPVRIERS